MIAPPWVNDESALVILDWSWWLNRAFRSQGLDGMKPIVVGWLCGMLAHSPAHVAIALDSPGKTFRHNMRHPTDEGWKYKDGREIKPDEFYDVARQLDEIAELHGIPCLWADGFEADDVIATATARARAVGYRVWICTADKDLHGLVEAHPTHGIVVGTWDHSSGDIRGPDQVREAFGVDPSQIADWLAIAGDSSDNVPGVDGLGKDKACDLLAQFGTLDAALNHAPWTPETFAKVEDEIKDLAKKAKKGDDDAAARRPLVLATRKIAKHHATLVENAEVARFSRALTALDCDVPIDVPWDSLPVGGFNAAALRKRFHDLGFYEKEKQVSSFPKRRPWGYPS